MLANKVKDTTQGPSLKGHFDFGAMTMPAQVNIVEDLVNDAVKNGAKVLAGGRRNPNYEEGNWYISLLSSFSLFFSLLICKYCIYVNFPKLIIQNRFETTVLTGANHGMRIVNEEVFGPVALLLPFESEAELLQMVNGTSYLFATLLALHTPSSPSLPILFVLHHNIH